MLAILACHADLRDEVLAFLSKAAGLTVLAPAASSAEELLTRLDAAAAGAAGEVVSLTWAPGDRGAVAVLNLHREKLRRGSSILVWCAPEDLEVLRTEGQDAYSFRDTLVIISGFSPPKVHVPSDDTPEIHLARARLELPGTPFEKALAAAELGTLLLDRGYCDEAATLCARAVQPFLEDELPEAGRGTIAHLAATLAATLAAAGAVSGARRWAEAALAHRIETGVASDTDLVAFLEAIEPASGSSVPAARLVHAAADHLPWEPFQRFLGVSFAEELARSGCLRAWAPKSASFAADPGEPEARGVIALARGEIGETEDLWREAAARSAGRDEDNRRPVLRLLDSLLWEGEIRCAATLVRELPRTRATDWLPAEVLPQIAWLLTLIGRVEKGRASLRIPPGADLSRDGLAYRRCSTLAEITVSAFLVGRLRAEDIVDTDSYLSTIAGLFPPPEDEEPPFYPILFAGLRADVLSVLPERRAEALDLARQAWERANQELPRHVPESAVRVATCLLLAGRLGDALDFLAITEPKIESGEELRALASLRALRVAAHVRRGDGAEAVHAAMGALRETLAATGSRTVAAQTYMKLALALPPDCAFPDIFALLDEASELFAEMPMVAHEERCREARGDVLLARGQHEEAAACYAASMRRLRHRWLFLRVPRLQAKWRHAFDRGPERNPQPR